MNNAPRLRITKIIDAAGPAVSGGKSGSGGVEGVGPRSVSPVFSEGVIYCGSPFRWLVFEEFYNMAIKLA